MSVLIDTRGLPASDRYQRLADDAPLPETAPAIVSLARWQAEPALHSRAGLAVELPNTADVLTLDAALLQAPMLVLQVPVFSDGRAFSQAMRLRRQRGYGGVLRVAGPVLPDQIGEWARCGVDEIESPRPLSQPPSFAAAASATPYQPDWRHAEDVRQQRNRHPPQ